MQKNILEELIPRGQIDTLPFVITQGIALSKILSFKKTITLDRQTVTIKKEIFGIVTESKLNLSEFSDIEVVQQDFKKSAHLLKSYLLLRLRHRLNPLKSIDLPLDGTNDFFIADTKAQHVAKMLGLQVQRAPQDTTISLTSKPLGVTVEPQLIRFANTRILLLAGLGLFFCAFGVMIFNLGLPVGILGAFPFLIGSFLVSIYFAGQETLTWSQGNLIHAYELFKFRKVAKTMSLNDIYDVRILRVRTQNKDEVERLRILLKDGDSIQVAANMDPYFCRWLQLELKRRLGIRS